MDQLRTRATAKKLGFELTGKWIDCVHCAKAKVTKKPIRKNSEQTETVKGDRISMDSTSCSKISLGGKRYANVKLDLFTNMPFCSFTKQKSDIDQDSMDFIKRVKTDIGRLPKVIRCDNAGENKVFKDRPVSYTHLTLPTN